MGSKKAGCILPEIRETENWLKAAQNSINIFLKIHTANWYDFLQMSCP